MSLEKRLQNFQETVVAKNLVATKHPSYASLYRRVFFTRRIAEFFFSALIIFGGHQLVIQNGFFSPLWPAAGVALSAVFLRGNALLAGIFAGTLSSYFYNHFSFLVSLHQALLFTLFIFFTRKVALFWIGTVTPIAKLSVFIKFCLLIALLCALHIFLISKNLMAVYGAPVTYFEWVVAWIGEFNGILCLAPLCLVFEPFVPQRYFHLDNPGWWLGAIFLTACHLLFFVVPSGMPSIILSAFLLIGLCVYAKYFGQIPTCITIFSISIIYLAGVQPAPHLFHFSSSKFDVIVMLTSFTLSMFLGIGIGTTVTNSTRADEIG